jgi:hypothetical protein
MTDMAYQQEAPAKRGYFTVNIPAAAGQSLPYIVFAKSDFEAARIVKQVTGFMPLQQDVEGPFQRF